MALERDRLRAGRGEAVPGGGGHRRPARDRQRQEAQHRRLRPRRSLLPVLRELRGPGLGRRATARSPRSSTTIRSRRWRPTSRHPSAPADGAGARVRRAPDGRRARAPGIGRRRAFASARRGRAAAAAGGRGRLAGGRAAAAPGAGRRGLRGAAVARRALRARLVRARLHVREAADRDRRDLPQAGLRGGAVGPAPQRARRRAGHVLRRRRSPAGRERRRDRAGRRP